MQPTLAPRTNIFRFPTLRERLSDSAQHAPLERMPLVALPSEHHRDTISNPTQLRTPIPARRRPQRFALREVTTATGKSS